ncbi:aspartate carbamoyltransferase catalytic subunit [Citreicella sp. C3M06]|uniref:aspartate carbamoyltransferase catalytic subunit n=1 Tax=Citreicella sp. C3M06 TaxID=2841564 RepID=UPI001C09F7E9|nr:aspartate carbamoyltransferase catalytic subunit [Citreicella sp. C3M06]MBU2959453.1 aspartate carbamoyltransferase catalytic subunit [Citreicella sp. C3M06]
MTKMQVNGSETGVVRLFHLDLPPQAVERFTTQAGTGEYPLKYGLGAAQLRPAFVDVVNIEDLGDMALSEYLRSAYAIPEAELGDMKPRIDALRGHVVVLPSQAFDHASQELTIAAPLRWVATFAEAAPRPRGPALRSKAAWRSADPASDDARPGSRRAMYITLIAIALLVVLIAGTLAQIS